ncbi:hypothetical protein QOZ80_2AG0109740 [Eleusine coracana subsp. coracana]|nr:hypothetical protein QOZ80_2AG0109740 [Eleusine coracana subsp. coracana]
MPRKRPAPSPAPPPPPPPPPQESSIESGSDTEEEEEPPRAAAAPKPPQNPQPHPTAAAADGDESSEAESYSDADTQAFQMRPVSRFPTKPAAPAPQPESDADDEEEDGDSSESEPEIPEPVQKKAAATKESKTVGQEDKKRPAPEPAPSGKGKKAEKPGDKLEDKKRPAPEPAPSGKGKKAKADPEKAKKPGDKLEKSGLDSSPPSIKSEKSARVNRTWSKEDLIKILEAMAAHVKREGALPKTDVLLAAVRDRLERKDCSYADLYNKIRHFKQRYEQIATMRSVPGGEDELRIYNLSEAIWGGKPKVSQNDSSETKSKKDQVKKEKIDGNSKVSTLKVVTDQNGDSQKGSEKGHVIQVKTERDVKSKLSKEDTTALTPSKSKKQGNGKEELGKDAKNGTSRETTTTATQNGDALTKRKRGKMDKDKMDIDLIPKASTGSQTGTDEETHEEETEIGSCVQRMRRSFDDLQNLYPCLAECVQRIEAQQSCGETLKRAFEFIGDEKAITLESKIKDQRSLEVKAQIYRDDLRKKVVSMLMGLMD